MKKLVVSLFVVAAFMVSSCDKGWKDEEKNAFIDSCVNSAKGTIGEEAAEKYCSCTQEKLEKEFPNVKDIDIESEAGKKIIEECSEFLREGE